jgi:hypothetical protein
MDFSASKEIWRFFSQYDRSNTVSLNTVTTSDFLVYPNPSTGMIYFQSEQQINEVTVLDLQGRTIEKISGNNILQIDIHHLKTGNYLLELSGNDFKTMKKITLGL